jgi:hypothetical protein
LILSANTNLTWLQVRQIIKETCDRIDPAGGKYNSKGHSIFYGYGRVNAEKAVKRALEQITKRHTRKTNQLFNQSTIQP